MKRIALVVLVSAASAWLLLGARRDGDGGGGGRGTTTIVRQRHVSIPPPSAPERVIQDRNIRISYPQRDERGLAIVQQPAASPPAQHAAIVRDASVATSIVRHQRDETTPHRHFWHSDGGVRYSHYFDGRDHWYGFYNGPTFYWTRYYDGRWWWFDERAARWVFWWNGYWWWPGPGGVAYAYIDDGYYPYDGDGVTVQTPVVQSPPAAVPPPSPTRAAISPDGRRMVQVSGAEAQAFLFDKTTDPPTFLRFLGQGVSVVRFSGGAGGVPLQILVESQDGSFALFDDKGDALGKGGGK